MTIKIEQNRHFQRKRKYQISFPTIFRTSKEVTAKEKRQNVNKQKYPASIK